MHVNVGPALFGTMAALVIFPRVSFAEPNPLSAPVVASSGAFDLRKGVDAFTDKATCVIVARDEVAVRSLDTVFMVLPGEGPFEGYLIRLDDKAPSDQSYATEYETRVGAVILDRYKFDNLTVTKRLRVRINYGARRDQIDYDIDLTGLSDLVAMWPKAGCPKSRP